MGNIFSASEILNIAIRIEKNGKDFYSAVAAQSKNANAREIFLYLAGEEEKHLTVFQKISSGLEKYEPAESFPGEYSSYMNALAGENIFTQLDKGKEIAKTAKNDLEAIAIGIKAEKDSIAFYKGMQKAVSAYDQNAVEEVIAQEELHLRQLTQLQKSI